MSSKQDSLLTLKTSVLKNNAVADGKQTNAVLVRVEDNGTPQEDIRIVFMIDGSALFVNSGTGVYTYNTNENGEITLEFTDNEIETVILTCFPAAEKENVSELSFEFIKVREVFKISRVQTKNQSLYYGEPTIIWTGGSILLTTSGGSGDVEWRLSGDSHEGIRLSTEQSGAAEVTAVAPFKGERSVTATDKITGETATHIFNILYYVILSDTPVTLLDFVADEKKSLLSREMFKLLFEQWGSLSSYRGWLPDTMYWTSEYNLAMNTALSFNSTTGIFFEGAYTSFNTEFEQGQAYTNKETR